MKITEFEIIWAECSTLEHEMYPPTNEGLGRFLRDIAYIGRKSAKDAYCKVGIALHFDFPIWGGAGSVWRRYDVYSDGLGDHMADGTRMDPIRCLEEAAAYYLPSDRGIVGLIAA